MRTILEIAQSAAPKIGIETPGALLSSTVAEDIELAALANELAERIARAHDWQSLKTVATFTGDGSTTGFAVPSDYLRMAKDSQMWSSRLIGPMTHITSSDQWLEIDVRGFDVVYGAWTILGDMFEFSPALASTETAKCYYISNKVVRPASGSDKSTFTLDTDTFRLGDRLLELHLIWEWRQRKGLNYAEDMITAENALAQAISDDKGARILRQAGSGRLAATLAWPGVLS